MKSFKAVLQSLPEDEKQNLIDIIKRIFRSRTTEGFTLCFDDSLSKGDIFLSHSDDDGDFYMVYSPLKYERSMLEFLEEEEFIIRKSRSPHDYHVYLDD